MIDLEKKQAYLRKIGKSNGRVYLPCPGIPVDLELNPGDQVLIDLALHLGVDRISSLNLDTYNESSHMLKINKQWHTIRSVSKPELDSYGQLFFVEGSSHFWRWYHVGAIRKKESLDIPARQTYSLPNI